LGFRNETQQDQILVLGTVEGFRYRSTQPTNSYHIILSVAFFFRLYIILKLQEHLYIKPQRHRGRGGVVTSS